MKRLLLLGGGHTHVEVIRRLGQHPPRDTEIILITPDRYTAYSGMLPGFVAGHYDFHDCHIDLDSLCGIAGVGLRLCHATGIDLAAKRVDCSDGSAISFDLLSIDIGSKPATQGIPGALEHAIRIKPTGNFIKAWNNLLNAVQPDAAPVRIAVVGGGAGGIELALAMHYRMLAENTNADIQVFTESPTILPGHPSRLRHIFDRVLNERGITTHSQDKVVKVDRGKLFQESGEAFDARFIAWVTAAGAPDWLAQSGIKTDARGFLEVNDFLQSVSHPCVFAAGDIASMINHELPKSGVFAVRQGPPLASNLSRALYGQPLVRYTPQKTALALISTGNKYAVAIYGNLIFKGKWVWFWKDHIDRNFIAKFNGLPK